MGWIIGFLRTLFPNLFKHLGKFLIGFIGPIITPIFQFVAQFFKKIVILLLIIAAIHIAISIFTAAIVALTEQLSNSSVPSYFEIGRMFLPNNLAFCISLLVVAKIKSLIFFWVHRLSENLIHT